MSIVTTDAMVTNVGSFGNPKMTKERDACMLGSLHGTYGSESPEVVCSWRGQGGRAPTYSSVEFDRQLDKISMWLEKWTHKQRCKLIEAILRRSSSIHLQFLYTVMQPHVHRDFIYTAKCEFPAIDFKNLSTPAAREAQAMEFRDCQRKLKLHRQNNYYREKSAYLKADEDVSHLINDKNIELRLPQIPTGACLHPEVPQIEKSSGSPSFHHLLKQTRQETNCLTRIKNSGNPNKRSRPLLFQDKEGERDSVVSSAPVLRFIDMPVRRHIQNEGSMKYLGSSLSSLNSHNFSSRMSSGNVGQRKGQTPILTPAMPNETELLNRVKFQLPDLDEDACTVIHWYTQEWSDLKKNEFLHKFLLKLDSRQHYFISSFLLVRQYRDFLTNLPEHIAINILDCMAPSEILKCSMVCHTWHRLACHNDLWKRKCQRINILVPIPDTPNWMLIYRDNLHLNANWQKGRCRTLDLHGHSDQVECVTFNNNYLASGSQDRTIKLWNIRSGDLVLTLKGHEKGVWCLDFFTDSLLISGSYDGTIRIWNLRTGECVRTLIAHDGPVWNICRHGNTLVSASQDKTAKIWDVSHCLLVHTLYGHTAAIFAVDLGEDGALVITGSADRSVRLWETGSGKLLKTLWVSQTTSVMAVSYSSGYIACSYGEIVCLYRVNKPKLVHTYQEHTNRVETLKLKITNEDESCSEAEEDEENNNESEREERLSGSLVSAGKDGVIKYWDLRSHRCVKTFKGHVGSVKDIKFDNLRIATAAKDKVRIWDFNFYGKTRRISRQPQQGLPIHPPRSTSPKKPKSPVKNQGDKKSTSNSPEKVASPRKPSNGVEKSGVNTKMTVNGNEVVNYAKPLTLSREEIFHKQGTIHS